MRSIEKNTLKHSAGLIISLIFIFSLANPVLSEETYKFERMWPALQQPWYFIKPSGIAIDSKGFVYIADVSNYIQKFTPDGHFVTKWGGKSSEIPPEEGKFNDPVKIAIDSQDYIYVTDAKNNRIQKFTSDGKFVAQWGVVNNPKGIAIDSKGFIYTITMAHNIQKFYTDGTFAKEWKINGTTEGEFFHPLAIDSKDCIYVADTNNNMIQKFNSDGEFISQWGTKGTNDGEFDMPMGIFIDKNDFVYVVDTNNHRIQQFTSDGEFVAKKEGKTNYNSKLQYIMETFPFKYPSSLIPLMMIQDSDFKEIFELIARDGEFQRPIDMAIDKEGSIYVADSNNRRIQKFTSEWEFITKWGNLSSSKGMFQYSVAITTDKNRNCIYVSDTNNHRIQKFDLNGTFIQEWGGRGSEQGEFESPWSITTDTKGNLYVTDSFNFRIQKFSSDGLFISEWGKEGDGDGEFLWLMDIAIDSNDYVYAIDIMNFRIQKFSSDGKFITKFNLIKEIALPTVKVELPFGITTDSDNFVYITTFYFDLRLGVGGDSGLDKPDYYIQKLNPDGTQVKRWGKKGIKNGEFEQPFGISVNNGFLYIADTGNNRIQKFTTDGEFITTIGVHGVDVGQLEYPIGIDVSDEKIYVADTGNNRIQVFRKGLDTDRRMKAVIVAGGGNDNNSLWEATEMNANFAYRALTYQGLTKETIFYLSPNTELDLDSNGKADDVDKDATNQNLQDILSKSISAKDTDSLVLYLVDHGSKDIFHTNKNESLKVNDFDSWLDSLQSVFRLTEYSLSRLKEEGISNDILVKLEDLKNKEYTEIAFIDALKSSIGEDGTDKYKDQIFKNAHVEVIVVYDACYSGTFLSSLTSPVGQRVVITSTSPDELAQFVTQGTISFSNYFWTHIFNGQNVRDSFGLARESIKYAAKDTINDQNALLDDNNDGFSDEDDGDYAVTAHIGNGTIIQDDAPAINSVSPDQTIAKAGEVTLFASGVTDFDGIAHVWAVIRPPDYKQEEIPGNPVTDLPSVELSHVTNNRYEGKYTFNKSGTYLIAIYATDSRGNTSVPKLTTVNVENPLKRRAILTVGYFPSEKQSVIEKNANLAYESLISQIYSDDDIYFMTPVASSKGFDASPSKDVLKYRITEWAKENTQDLVLYMIGYGDKEVFRISETENLSATELDNWVDELQNNSSCKAIVIYDSCYSGSFLSLLKPPDGKERIVITSSKNDQPAYFLSQGDISFSQYIWSGIANGENLEVCFLSAKRAFRDSTELNQTPQLDDNGDGVYDNDGEIAENYIIGAGISFGASEPTIEEISSDQTLNGETSAIIWAKNVSPSDSKVWAVVQPPEDISECLITDEKEQQIELLYNPKTERYEAIYEGFSDYGKYTITIYVESVQNKIRKKSEIMSASVEQLCKNQENLIIGDIDGNNIIDLNDAVLALKIIGLSGGNMQTDCLKGTDVNKDNKIGIEDVIYILQVLIKLR